MNLMARVRKDMRDLDLEVHLTIYKNSWSLLEENLFGINAMAY